MERTLLLIITLLTLLPAVSRAGEKGDVRISVKVKDYAKQPVVLGYYFDEKMLVKDTVMTDNSSVAVFKRDSLYDEGVYVVYIPDRYYFDILMPHEQVFDIVCDTLPMPIERVKVSGNKQVKTFIDYQKYLSEKQQTYAELNKRYREANGDTEAQSKIRSKFLEVEREVKDHNDKLIAENQDNFISTFLTALKDIEVPDMTPQGDHTDRERDSIRQTRQYYYYKQHFFDNFDMTDARLLRTPFFVSKVTKYVNETVLQMPDTVASECIRIIEMCRPNKEMFRYFVSHFYNMANKSNIMGMDAALVTLADKYYLSGEADWASEKFISDLREQVDGIRYTLIGGTAHDMKMPSYTGEWFKLHEVKAPYTILVFWEPSCGHCKKEIPHMHETLWKKFEKYGVKIFAVYCQVDEKPWTEFIEEHQLEDWINVYDPYGKTGFRKYYNIKSTPTIFVLDKDKKIVAKKLGVDQISDFLSHMLELD